MRNRSPPRAVIFRGEFCPIFDSSLCVFTDELNGVFVRPLPVHKVLSLAVRSYAIP